MTNKGEQFLADRLYEMALKNPSKAALISAQEETSYASLLQSIANYSQQLANYPRGSRIALLMENSRHSVAAYYASWWQGHTVVALNFQLKAAEILNLLTHCGAAVLLADSKHAELANVISDAPNELELGLIGDIPPQLMSLNSKIEKWETLLQNSPLTPPIPGEKNALAAIIYTSGTTGQPKGVMLSHANFAANTSSIQQCLDIRADDRAMCVLPFFYSYGSSILHTHLSLGACIVINNSMMYPQRVLEQMAAEKVTSFYGVPSTYYLLLNRCTLSNFNLDSLRYCAQAGGAMDSKRITEFTRLLPDIEFVVMYGQTEATARLTCLKDFTALPGSVGKAIDGVEIRIVGQAGETLPAGETGEVYVKGSNIMLGYLGDPDTTAATVVDDWLHTGDTGYLNENGFLFLIGRSKEMIKSGANRISPAEIEEIIASIPGIVEVAVIGVEDALLGQVVKAFVVVEDSESNLKQRIQYFCRQNLASYKVPKQIEILAQLPKTASGKIQKYLLK